MALALVSYGSSDDSGSDEEEIDLSTAASTGSRPISADVSKGGPSIEPVPEHGVDFGIKNGIGDGHITDEDSDVANSHTDEETDTEKIPLPKNDDARVNVADSIQSLELQTLNDGARVLEERRTGTVIEAQTDDYTATSERRQQVKETQILKNSTAAADDKPNILNNSAASTKEEPPPVRKTNNLNDDTSVVLTEIPPLELETETVTDNVSSRKEESHTLNVLTEESKAINEHHTVKDDAVKEKEPVKEMVSLDFDTGHITDEDDDETMSRNTHEKAETLPGLSLLKENVSGAALKTVDPFSLDDASETIDLPVGKPESAVSHSIKDLPAPKPHVVSLANVEEDELEEIVKPKATQLAAISKPARSKTVKISAPVLQVYDDDDEEDTPSKKKPRLSVGKCGLSALLPAPKHQKDSNRPLIPYTLTKKAKSSASASKPVRPESKTAASATVHRKASSSAASILPGIDAADGSSSSDDDEDGDSAKMGPSSNFFSITDKPLSREVNTTDSLSANVQSESILPVSLPIQRRSLNLPQPVHGGEKKNKDSLVENKDNSHRTKSELEVDSSKLDHPLSKKSKSILSSSVLKSSQKTSVLSSSSLVPYSDDIDAEKMDLDPEEEEQEDLCGSLGDAPLQFHGSVKAPYKPAPYLAGPSWKPQGYVQSYPQANVRDVYSSGGSGSGDSTNQILDEPQSLDQAEVDEYLHDSAFLKFQGKKERGKQAINFIDAKPDYSGGGTELLKGISEESNIEYQVHRKKDNMPSSQQKRKHQITYLAFQAKERELDLKNQWAQNRQTKRQTQSKYGF